jgi:two-component system, OmpR family, response regulator
VNDDGRVTATTTPLVTPTQQARVLIVEDDEDIALGIGRTLKTIGCQVEVAGDGDAGLAMAVSGAFDMVVVDLLLPKMNGFLLCSRLRDVGIWIPVLVLTAKTGEWDEAEALDSGADDFLTKPVSATVLVAHVRAQLRRSRRIGARDLSYGDLRLKIVRHECSVGETTVDLSARETEVLAHLMLRQGEVVSKRDLMLAVWGTDFPGNPNIVEVYVRHLRKKLGELQGEPVIETVWGSGYRLTARSVA